MSVRDALVDRFQQREFDIIVVGAGSAGSVLASRLSEDGRRNVLLLEAGADTPPSKTPADIDDTFPTSTLNPSYFWSGLNVQLRRNGPVREYMQARVAGGGSSIMGMFALRGVPTDYQRWADAGAAGWSWEQALQKFRMLEGRPEPSRRLPQQYPVTCSDPAEWPPYVQAMCDEALRRGVPYIPDINEHPTDGFFPLPAAHRDDVRSTSARCYLTEEVRRRANLSILTDATANNVLFRGVHARGVSVTVGGREMAFRSKRVAVCAGAIFSPALLMRSGVGPGEHLAEHNIPLVANRRGVGANLQNHWYVLFGVTLPAAKRTPHALRRFGVAGMRSSSSLPGCPPSDLFLFMLSRVSGRSFGTGLGMVAACLYSPFSQGEVRLASRDPAVLPHVNFNMMSHPLDESRMIAATRLAESLVLSPSVAAEYNDAFLLPSALAAKQFNRSGVGVGLIDIAANIVLASPRQLRRIAFLRGIRGSKLLCNEQRVTDQDILEAVAPMGHVAGTCAVGTASDPRAVVDEEYRVIGTQGLYVVDASVMPVVPSANTNLPTIMLGEHAAERIASAWNSLGQR